jgi:hypothetical protein
MPYLYLRQRTHNLTDSHSPMSMCVRLHMSECRCNHSGYHLALWFHKHAYAHYLLLREYQMVDGHHNGLCLCIRNQMVYQHNILY